MSTYLELVQNLHTEVGAAGEPPSTVLNQRGEAARLVNWIKRADEYIQEMWENWKFLRVVYDESTTASAVALPILQDVSFWDNFSFKIYDTVTDLPDDLLEVVEYDAIKNELRDVEENRPFRVIIMPDNTLEVEPTPDDAYRITADAYIAPTLLAADDDISSIPTKFHQAILGRAMILYANYENAPEIKTQGQEIYSEQLTRLQNNQLPNKFLSQFRTGGVFEVIAE